MELADWEQLSSHANLRSVIDPNDTKGFKNILIDRVHWHAVAPALEGAKKVLDFGCGVGRFARRISALGAQYTGIDYSDGMIRGAQKFNNKTGVLAFRHFDGKRIPFPDKSFDTVFVSRVFMHILKDPQCALVLVEIKRVLAPGGRLVLLEEASLSDKKSGQAPYSLTEQEYLAVLGADFDVKVVRKVRSSEFSKVGRRWTEWGDLPYPVFRLILPILVRYEARRVAQFENDNFAMVTYYDFLIEAVKKEQ